jgi:proline racemase
MSLSAASRHRRAIRSGSSRAGSRWTVAAPIEFEPDIGGRFQCRIEGETMIGEARAIVPGITGRTWITGRHQHLLDPADPWPSGYRLSNTWPMPSGPP